MYSDEWIKDKSLRTTERKSINNTANIYFWLNDNDELVGVSINFELANDVHYELKANEWYRFLNQVLKVDNKENYLKYLRDFLESSSIPQVNLAIVLNQNAIEYKKVAFLISILMIEMSPNKRPRV